MEKIKNRTSKYEISVRPYKDKYFNARISINLGGGISKRIEKYGKTQDEAVLNLLIDLQTYITDLHSSNSLICKIDNIVSQRLIKSINDLGIISNDIMQKTLEIVNSIQTINAQIDNRIYYPSNVVPFNSINSTIPTSNQPRLVVNNEYNSKPKKESIHKIEDILIDWKKYELSLCVKSDENPRPLGRRTADNHISCINKIILPFFKSQKLIYISQVNEKVIRSLTKSLNGYDNKRIVDITLRLLFKYLKKNNIIAYNIMLDIEKPKRPIKTEESDIVIIESEKQVEYLDKFEADNTNLSILFETMLLSGIRPEEACRFKMDCIRY